MFAVTVLMLALASTSLAGSMFVVDDGIYPVNYGGYPVDRAIRVRRQVPGPPPPLPVARAQTQGRIRKQRPVFIEDQVFQAPVRADERGDLPSSGSSSYGKHPKGRVGPVYTFVKTDYDANFKWGVRHVAGNKYAGRR